jgi:hypothetical protein
MYYSMRQANMFVDLSMFLKCDGSCLSVVAWELRPAEIMAKSEMLAKS